MLKLEEVLTCRRMINYEGFGLEYTTGLTDVFVNASDCVAIIQNKFTNNFGYVNDLKDIVYLLKKHKCLSKAMEIYDDETLEDYLWFNHINIDIMIKLCEKVKCDRFKSFLTNVKDVVNKYGLYVPEPKMKHYDKNRNTDKNLAETLDLNAVAEYAYRTGNYEDNVYIELAHAISRIIFDRSIDDIRMYYDMLYEDYVSDYITDFEYDMMAYCCKVASYLLMYSDISIPGMEVLIKGMLDVALEDFGNPNYRNARTNFGESQAIGNIFDKAMNNIDQDYDEPQRKLNKRKHLSDEEINEFKKYL